MKIFLFLLCVFASINAIASGFGIIGDTVGPSLTALITCMYLLSEE